MAAKFGHYLLSSLLVSLSLIIFLLIKNNAAVSAQSSRMLLWNLMINSGIVILMLSVSLVIALYQYRKKITKSMSYGKGFGLSVSLVFIGSFMAGIFQIIYTTLINTDYIGILRQQDRRAMENMGVDESVIQQTLSQSYSNWSLFSNTFIYFLLLGLFVSLLVTAYVYKRNY